MPLYSFSSNSFEAVPTTSFSQEELREQDALQEALSKRIEAIDPNLLVIAKEFNRWEGSNKRIDLLALDKNANLVVIELKRTSNDRYADLQAIRYAGLVSVLSSEEIIETYQTHLRDAGSTEDAEAKLREFLGIADLDEVIFAARVRIILVAQDFSEEVVATVLWLNSQGLDISCFRLTPYNKAGEVLIYIEQFIPLPEAREWQDKFKTKTQDASQKMQHDRNYRLDVTVDGQARERLPKGQSILFVVREIVSKGKATPEQVAVILERGMTRTFAFVEGRVSSAEFRQLAQGYDLRRFFTADEDLIHHDGKTYAFTNQWGDPNFTQSMQLLKERVSLPIEFTRSA